MIDTIIFDFGDVFINLDKSATEEALKKLGLPKWNKDLSRLNIQFETGKISPEDFLLGFYSDFYQCFEKVYFSFEIGLRKPNADIFNLLIEKHALSAKRTLFVDDKKENTDAALSLGFQVWNLQVGEEDVVDLFSKKELLF
jgi:FMN phosphatase YigB (HAD superfamily)